jgi:AraC-like DNA-binding protein
VPASATHAHVQRMLEEIHARYADRLNLVTLARMLGRQAAYLGRLFRKEVGVTVHDYITRIRIEKGASQVRAGEKIEAVALCIGYRSKKNFYRQFRRFYGCTPEKYRHGGESPHPSRDRSPDPRAHAADLAIPDGHAPRARPTKAANKARVLVDRACYQRLKLTLVTQQLVLNTCVGSPFAMLLTDKAGRCVGANRTAVSMTGYSFADLRFMPVEGLLETDRGNKGAAGLQIILPTAKHLPPNALLRTKSSAVVQVHCISAGHPRASHNEILSILPKSVTSTEPASTEPASSYSGGVPLLKGSSMGKLLPVPETEWSNFFDRMANALLGKWAEIEVASLDLRDQVVAEWVPLLGITYEASHDLVDVGLDRVSHLIRHPREVIVEQGTSGLASVAILDADGARQIVRLREPLMLPAPDTAHPSNAPQ